MDETTEEAGFPLPQYFVEPSVYNSNNEAHKVFDKLSDWSKDSILEPHKECTLTTDAIEAQFPTKHAYHVAFSDAMLLLLQIKTRIQNRRLLLLEKKYCNMFLQL